MADGWDSLFALMCVAGGVGLLMLFIIRMNERWDANMDSGVWLTELLGVPDCEKVEWVERFERAGGERQSFEKKFEKLIGPLLRARIDGRDLNLEYEDILTGMRELLMDDGFKIDKTLSASLLRAAMRVKSERVSEDTSDLDLLQKEFRGLEFRDIDE